MTAETIASTSYTLHGPIEWVWVSFCALCWVGVVVKFCYLRFRCEATDCCGIYIELILTVLCIPRLMAVQLISIALNEIEKYTFQPLYHCRESLQRHKWHEMLVMHARC